MINWVTCYQVSAIGLPTIYVHEPSPIVLVVRGYVKSSTSDRCWPNNVFINGGNSHLTSRFCRVVLGPTTVSNNFIPNLDMEVIPHTPTFIPSPQHLTQTTKFTLCIKQNTITHSLFTPTPFCRKTLRSWFNTFPGKNTSSVSASNKQQAFFPVFSPLFMCYFS